jgi:energy-coupling factor transport system ATP-binding protein
MIDISDLTYTYPQRDLPALHNVSLQIAAGEFVLVTGPSGAGKSTLLRCLNGLVPHFSGGVIAGTVCIAGVDVIAAGMAGLGSTVGFVFQSPEAQAVLDRVEPEIAFALENAAVDSAEMVTRVESAMALLDLTALRDRPLRSLSGGERQRVAIASALVLQPSLLVLDEPTSQLDPKSAEAVLHSLIRLNKELGLTIVLAEHRLDRVLAYADRLIFVDEGTIAVDGSVRDAVREIPVQPPVVELGLRLGWEPLPLTVAEAQRFVEDRHHQKSFAKSQRRNGSMMLEVEQLVAGYEDNMVLGGVKLRVAAGEIVGVVGRNGSGKSTLLKAIVGLLAPQSGEIKLMGAPIGGKSVSEICRQVGYLPQNPDDLLFADSVLDELLTTLDNHGLVENPPIEPQELLSELGLESVATLYPRDLSVGQRQRVALATILVTQPRLLLLDEPTRGLDVLAKKDLIALLDRWRTQGLGVVLVTHDVELAAQVTDRVVIIQDGVIVAEGDSAEILPASPDFAPQIARLYPGTGWLTVDDVVRGQIDTNINGMDNECQN